MFSMAHAHLSVREMANTKQVQDYTIFSHWISVAHMASSLSLFVGYVAIHFIAII